MRIFFVPKILLGFILYKKFHRAGFCGKKMSGRNLYDLKKKVWCKIEMNSQLYKEECLYSVGESRLCEESYRAIKKTIYNNHAVGFIAGYYDENLTIAYISEFFLYNLGYSYEEFMETTSGSLKNTVQGENRFFIEGDRFRSIQGDGEMQLLSSEGILVNVHCFKKDAVDANGEAIWILSTHMDEMQENLKLINQVIRSGFWSVDFDKNGKCKSVLYSHEFRAMLGYRDVLDFPNRLEVWDESIHPDDRERVEEAFYGAIDDRNNQKKYNVKYRMRLSDGSYEWFQDSAEIIRRRDGSAYRMAGIFVNIDKEERLLQYTREVDAERKILEDKNRMMDLLIQGTTRLVDRYAACDLENDFYQFYSKSMNDSAYEPTGAYHDFVAAMASSFKTISNNLTLEQAFSPEVIREKLKKPEDIYRFEYCTKDEKQFKSIAISPLSWTEGPEAHVCTVLFMAQNTTAEKLVEIESRKALREAYEAAERASKAKTEFLSNMSHDIRTPMNAIVGMTAIAGANIDSQDRVVDCLSKITQSSRHLLSLINEVLDMARIESGKITLVEEDFNLSELCENLVSMIKGEADLHEHQFNVHINKIEHEDVCGDSMRIQQLVINILSNAVKYTPNGGKIDFTISEIPTSSAGLGCYQFVVEDNGIGMTKEFQKVLFEPFSRADDKRTSKIQGTGLGMTIARNFAQMMNGDIKVKSAPGKGSRFTITIFLKQQNKGIGPIEELIDLPVLVVDDDRNCCETTVALLNEIGIDGEWVTSGAEAVERTVERYERDDNYFAIIIDWKMPGMDGIETTRQIRKRVGNDVTIIILSAYDYAEIEQEARDAGVDEFISKPLFRSRLTATLKNIVQGKPSAAARHYLEDISSCDFSGKRILLVEDNELNREIAQEIISMTGAEVETAENGKDAVGMMSAAKKEYYDLVFMDIQMPVMNGYEATAAIRSLRRPEGKTIPIVAMTANAFAEDILLAKNAGMNEHISKPLEMTRLREVLRRWLQ